MSKVQGKFDFSVHHPFKKPLQNYCVEKKNVAHHSW